MLRLLVALYAATARAFAPSHQAPQRSTARCATEQSNSARGDGDAPAGDLAVGRARRG